MVLAGMLAAAVALRLLVGLLFHDSLAGLSNDAGSFDRIARSLATGGGFRDPAFYGPADPFVARPPLTPFFIAGLYALFGVDPMIARIAFALVGGLTCLAIYGLGRELLGERVGLLAGGLAAIYPMFIVVSGLTLSDNLSVLLVTWAVLLLCRTRSSGRTRDAMGAGLVVGLAALNRPVALVLAVVGVLVLTLGAPLPRRARLQAASALVGLALLTVVPWTMRQSVERGEFIPITGYWAVFLGNLPATYQQTSFASLATGQPGSMVSPEVAEILVSYPAPVRRQLLRDHVFEYAIHHPWEMLQLLGLKLWLFWTTYPHPVSVLSWLGVSALALMGLAATWRRRSRLVVLYAAVGAFMLAHVLTFALPRHRLSIEGLLLVLAAAGLDWTVAHRWKFGLGRCFSVTAIFRSLGRRNLKNIASGESEMIRKKPKN